MRQKRHAHAELKTSLTTIALLVATSFAPAYAQQNAGNAGSVSELDTVVVLGSSRQDQTVLTSSSPIDVITPQQLKESGSVTLNQALSKLNPSFNFPQGQNAMKGQGVRAASLRGVAPGYTLVLVNGKRRNPSAQLSTTDPWTGSQVVDLNVIPISAVARVEILRDGAAAQYGSDAIAGVINIVLKENAEGGEVNAALGGYTDGGGFTKILNGWKGFQLGEDGFLNISADILKNDQVSRVRDDWRQLYPDGDPRNTTAGQDWGGKWGQASRDNWSILANGEVGINSNVRAYGYLNYADKTSNNFVNFERVVQPVTKPIAGVSKDLVTDPRNYNTNYNPWLAPNGYQPNYTYRAKDLAALGGVRIGNEQDGKLDLGVSYGRNETGRWAYNQLNASYGAAAPTSAYLGSWKNDSTSFTADYVKEVKFGFLDEPATVNAGLLHRNEHWQTGDVADPWAYNGGPLSGATLLDLYKTYPSLYPYAWCWQNGNNCNNVTAAQSKANGSSAVIGTNGGTGIKPTDQGSADRTVNGGYLGIDFKLWKKLDVGLTARRENYSDFGQTNNYRATARYEASPQVAFRGTLSSGFHAPALAALGTQSSSTAAPANWGNAGGVSQSGGSIALASADGRTAAFGGKPLQPEKSDTVSFGAVFRPTQTSSLTVDAYRLKIKGVITTANSLSTSDPDAAKAAAVKAAMAAAGIDSSVYSSVSFNINGFDLTQNGIDIVGKQQFTLPNHAKLDLSLGLSFLDPKVSNVQTVNIGALKFKAINGNALRDAETGTPKNKIILGSRYSQGSWIFDGTVTRYGKYRYNAGDVQDSVATNGNHDQVFPAETYVDVGAVYKWNKDLRVSALVQNLFNKYPNKYDTWNSASGINPYSFIAPNGAAGRFVQLGLNYSF